jgi:ABC-type transport system substrate-binding protein
MMRAPTEEPYHMHWTRILTIVLMIALLDAGAASAQTVLRIGLNDDPDALDPTISRAYVGRLVFAAFCDKLFDVTPDLKIVPQLATSYEWGAAAARSCSSCAQTSSSTTASRSTPKR